MLAQVRYFCVVQVINDFAVFGMKGRVDRDLTSRQE
jgi:hypothetical protein